MNEEDFRRVLGDELKPMRTQIDRLEERLFIGTPERQSLQEDIAEIKAKQHATEATVTELRQASPDKDFAKKIAAIVLALITTGGAIYGVAQASPARPTSHTGATP